MTLKTYTARCTLDGDWWAITVHELKAVRSRVRRLDRAEAVARGAIGEFLKVGPDSFDVQLQPVLPPALQAVADRARGVRGRAEELQREAAAVSVHAARQLVLEGNLTVREAGQILGLSHQRVTQLLQS